MSKTALTAKEMLSLPRPGSSIPNPIGTLYAFASSTFDFHLSRTDRSLYVGRIPEVYVDSESNKYKPIKVLDGLSFLPNPVWLDNYTLVYLRPPYSIAGDHDIQVSESDEQVKENQKNLQGVEVWALKLNPELDFRRTEEYLIGELPTSISDLSYTSVDLDKGYLTFVASVGPDGDLFGVKEMKANHAKEKVGDGMVFDSLYVRHWDEWIDKTTKKKPFVVPVRKSVYLKDLESSTRFEFDQPGIVGSQLTNSLKSIINTPLKDVDLECPVGPFGGSEDFAVSSEWIVFIAKDPHVNPAWHTRTNVYLLPLRPRSVTDSRPRLVTSGNQGACSSPSFDSVYAAPRGVGGKKGRGRIAYLEMREDGYEADRNRVMIFDLETETRYGLTENWDRSPSKVFWDKNGENLFLVASEHGHILLWCLPLDGKSYPVPLTSLHSVSSAFPISSTRLILSMNSFTTPNETFLLTTETGNLYKLASVAEPLLEGKELDVGESFYFDGTADQKVHGWILRPPGFQKIKHGYPLAFLIHGGPQGAFEDNFSTRWNPNVFTAAGYIVVMINFTGSTGFGQKFCDDMKGQWGGRPYQDLVAGLRYALATYDEIDPDRTVALGASYGGYMINWIQGHNDAMGFKALVCHDGVMSTTTAWYTTEELYFPEREHMGTPFQHPEDYQRWDPLNHIAKWKTPQLVIHGSKDYRLPETEGLGIFNALQRRGIPSRLLIFPNENHWVLNPKNSLQWHHEVFRWIDEFSQVHANKTKTKEGIDQQTITAREGYHVQYA